jgi:hypothetical protein
MTSRSFCLRLATAALLALAGGPRDAFAQTAPPATGDPVVHFEPNEPDVVFYVWQGERAVSTIERERAFRGIEYYQRAWTDVLEPVCKGQCAIPMQLGTHRVGLGHADGSHVAAEDPIEINGPSAVHGELVDRSTLRTVGYTIFFGGLATGLGLTAAAFVDSNDQPYLFASAGAVLVPTLLIGSILGSQKDKAIFTVTPLTTGLLRGAPERMSGRVAPEGLEVGVRF